jgi:CHASE2 domain-containing sensor protein
MEWQVELLAVLLAGLTAILAVVGAVAAVRLRDARLGFVTAALALLSLVGALAFLHEASPLYGGPFDVDPVPLALALGAAILLYGSLFRRRPKSSPP